MKHYVFATILAAFTVSAASGQSLNVSSPAPLQAGVNSSTTDNFTGTHYW